MLFAIGCAPAVAAEAEASSAGSAMRGVVFLVLAGFVAGAERRRRKTGADGAATPLPTIPPPPSSRPRARLKL
jgi:hypothetical protein